MRRSLLDTDKLNSVGLRRTGNVTMGITDAVQDYTKEEQVVGAAAFFILLCKTFGVSAPEMFQIADRVIQARHKDQPELIAAEDYMKGELL
jgi:hypothetical protein